MKLGATMLGGLTGACTLTVAHEVLRRTVTHPPRMDILGERGLTKVLKATGLTPPRGQALFEATLAGDVLSNAATYALIGTAKGAPLRGTLLGVALGVGAVTLPGPLGLGKPPGRQWPKTDLLTVGLYALGGLVAGLVIQAAADR
jgi:hypothetical protein